MAIFHFTAKVIGRSAGRSAVAAAAYRSAGRLHDERLDRDHDFTNKSGVVHSEVLLPENAPDAWLDREQLWNEVEAFEKRKDAQLAREIEFAIPREMNREQGIALAREFVQTEFVDAGMVADLNVHWDVGADGQPKPHAHVMLTMREVLVDENGEAGFGQKVREWNRTECIEQWRERWAEHVNGRLAELDIDVRVDHRSLEAQGVELEPQDKIGSAAARMGDRGLELERIEQHRAIARRNGERIIANPALALDAITHQQATFTARDLARFAHRHSDGKEQFDAVMGAVRASPELVELGQDGRGTDRFTSREMIECEHRLERAADRLSARRHHGLPAETIGRSIASAGSGGLVLASEQKAVLERILNGPDLANVTGYAGTGKSAALGIARDGWERAGYRVRGAALSGIAAEGLENGSGIASRTIASLEHQWNQGRELLSPNDVLVIDEAGMIGTRQMEGMISEADRRGAKLVLVGDVEQLQAIEAGAAFRSITERHGSAEITEVRRQREDWQRDATRQLATERTGEAIAAYDRAGRVHAAATREEARAQLIDRWDRDRQQAPDDSRIILTHTNDDVRALNEAARTKMRDRSQLGKDIALDVTRGDRELATGDRVMFLRNERSLGVKNGTLGTIGQLSERYMSVRTDDGRSIAFDPKDYRDLDYGYAATIHKAQGMTIDRVHVLATPGMDRHSAYVALSRHRDGVDLHYGRHDFADRDRLVRVLSRERAKDMATDYRRADLSRDPAISLRKAFAERRGIMFRERVAEIVRKVPEKARGIFDNFRPKPRQPDIASPEPMRASGMRRAVERYARALDDIGRMHERQLPVLPHQRDALARAQSALDTIGPHARSDLESAFERNPELIRPASQGNSRAAIRAMQLEAEIRSDPFQRADRFAQDWQHLHRQRGALTQSGEHAAARAISERMGGMANSLKRDAQMESILRTRKAALGIDAQSVRPIGRELAEIAALGGDRDRSLGIEIGM